MCVCVRGWVGWVRGVGGAQRARALKCMRMDLAGTALVYRQAACGNDTQIASCSAVPTVGARRAGPTLTWRHHHEPHVGQLSPAKHRLGGARPHHVVVPEQGEHLREVAASASAASMKSVSSVQGKHLRARWCAATPPASMQSPVRRRHRAQLACARCPRRVGPDRDPACRPGRRPLRRPAWKCDSRILSLDMMPGPCPKSQERANSATASTTSSTSVTTSIAIAWASPAHSLHAQRYTQGAVHTGAVRTGAPSCWRVNAAGRPRRSTRPPLQTGKRAPPAVHAWLAVRPRVCAACRRPRNQPLNRAAMRTNACMAWPPRPTCRRPQT